uniref:Uncharacterized protein n=1 Tax=Panagrellus redivivus TaxID=6233 RepID=A0A7E4VVB1_PANRE
MFSHLRNNGLYPEYEQNGGILIGDNKIVANVVEECTRTHSTDRRNNNHSYLQYRQNLTAVSREHNNEERGEWHTVCAANEKSKPRSSFIRSFSTLAWTIAY